MRVMLRRLRLVTHMIYVGLLIDWVGWGEFACCIAGEELFCFRWSTNFRVMAR